jgi:hypothetical protein
MARARFRKIPKPASQTDEGRKRLEAYCLALGQFVDQFSKVESSLHLLLRWQTKTTTGTARAVFSGVRADAAAEYVRRLHSVGIIDPREWVELEPVLNQVKAINTMRNDILHQGAMAIAEGRGFTTNALRALTEQHIKSFPVSPEMLADMTADLRKIFIHLAVRHCGRPALRGKHPELEEVLRGTWRYKPPQPLQTQSSRESP